MKENLVIILSHCDTRAKIETLKDKIESLKMLDLDIMLLSHYPVSTYIQKQVNYFIYDQSNPLLNHSSPEKSRGVIAWSNITDQRRDKSFGLFSMLPDAGWAVFNKIKKAADISLPLGYRYYSIINYDLDLNHSFAKQLKNLDFEGDILLSWSRQENDDRIMGKGPGLLFSILKKEAFSKIRQAMSKEDYIETREEEPSKLKYKFAEEYWGHLTEPFDISYTEETSISVVNTLSDETMTYPQTASAKQPEGNLLFRIFFEGKPPANKVFIFNIKKGGPIKFKINGEKLIEVSYCHLEENMTTISYINSDGVEYSFDEERKRAKKLSNEIFFPVKKDWHP